jgi:hypothetical protein
MAVSRGDAIRLAIRFAEANGYRVIDGFASLPWSDEPRQVKFQAARWVDREWAVLFDKRLHPKVDVECPGDLCVLVAEDSGECRSYPLL